MLLNNELNFVDQFMRAGMFGGDDGNDNEYAEFNSIGLTPKQKLYDWFYLTAAAAWVYTLAWYMGSFSVYNSEKLNVENNAINSLNCAFFVSLRDVAVTAKLREARYQFDKDSETRLDGTVAVQVGTTCSSFLGMFLYNAITPAVFVIALPYFSQRFVLPYVISSEAEPIVGCAANIALSLLLWSVKVAVFHCTGLDEKLKVLNQLQPMAACDKAKEVLSAWGLNTMTLGITYYIAGGVDLSLGVACSVALYQLSLLFQINCFEESTPSRVLDNRV
jgi:hypothetical protein